MLLSDCKSGDKFIFIYLNKPGVHEVKTINKKSVTLMDKTRVSNTELVTKIDTIFVSSLLRDYYVGTYIRLCEDTLGTPSFVELHNSYIKKGSLLQILKINKSSITCKVEGYYSPIRFKSNTKVY